jgi:hypothetical protein
MNTRSRQRQKQAQQPRERTPDSPTPNGSGVAKPDGAGVGAGKTEEGEETRLVNGVVDGEETVVGTPVKMRQGIYRVPLDTWNLFVRKWEIPRKTLHVSIGTPAQPHMTPPPPFPFPSPLRLCLLELG